MVGKDMNVALPERLVKHLLKEAKKTGTKTARDYLVKLYISGKIYATRIIIYNCNSSTC